MADTELQKAFAALAEAFKQTQGQLNENLGTVQQQIDQLKEKIVLLTGQLQTLEHDKGAIKDMHKRYSDKESGAVEF